jgi:hypothetical protein
VLEHRDARVGEDARDQRLGHQPARLRAPDVQDAAPAVRTLEPQRQTAVRVAVEDDPERLHVVDAVHAVVAEDLDGGRVAEAVARGQRVLDVERGSSSGSTAAATPPWAQNEFEACRAPFVTSTTSRRW